LKPQTVWRQGAGLVSLAGLGLVAVAVWQAVAWWPHVDKSLHGYALQRYLFVLATLVDVPILESLVAGVTLWWAGILRSVSAIPSQAEGQPAGAADVGPLPRSEPA
jgi:hypothetical protein